MRKILSIVSFAASLFASAQINLSEGFENTTYPGFTNVSFFRSSVITACVGTYVLNRNFWSGGTVGSTTYASTASNGGKLDISFKYKTHIYSGGSVNGTMKVEYSTDGGNTYSAIQTINLSSVISCTNFTATLPQGTVAAGSDFRLRVSGQWTSGDYWLVLDDFKITQSPFLAASEVSKKENFVYPNPFNSTVFINNVEKVSNVTISDVSGKIVQTMDLVSKEINLSNLKTGVYILSVKYMDGTTSTEKIVKK